MTALKVEYALKIQKNFSRHTGFAIRELVVE